jgi:uncharacterized protein
MKPIFVDASFWIALRDLRDPLHSTARAIGGRVGKTRRLVTTVLVFAEIHAYFARIDAIKRQLKQDFWAGGAALVEHAGPSDYAAAFSLLEQMRDKSYSFCDAVSFVVMRRLGLREALSFDDHFRQIGEFEILT